MTPTPCILITNGTNTYEVVSFNREIGKLVLRSQYGTEVVALQEAADRNGYHAVRGVKVQDPNVEGRVRLIPV